MTSNEQRVEVECQFTKTFKTSPSVSHAESADSENHTTTLGAAASHGVAALVDVVDTDVGVL